MMADCPYCGRIMWLVSSEEAGCCSRCRSVQAAARRATEPLKREIAELKRLLRSADGGG